MIGKGDNVCIKYINDLELEIKILNDFKDYYKNDNTMLENEISKKENLLKKCKDNLSKFSDNKICYRIYLNILNGMTPSKAIEKVAEENYLHGIKPSCVRTLWTNYYRKIKKILETSVKSQ